MVAAGEDVGAIFGVPQVLRLDVPMGAAQTVQFRKRCQQRPDDIQLPIWTPFVRVEGDELAQSAGVLFDFIHRHTVDGDVVVIGGIQRTQHILLQ
ncbi:hypothetical protein D9M71_423880 [compost metagenome]